MRQKIAASRLILSFVIVAAFTVAYVIFHFETHDQERLRAASENLLLGETHWITFQNRILAPLLILALRAVTGWSWMRAFYVLAAGCMLTGGFLLVWRSGRETGDVTRGLGQTASWFLLAILFNHAWSYPWDFAGVVLNLLLVIWARDSFHSLEAIKSWRLAAVLGGLMLNRESSLLALAALLVAVVAAGGFEKQPVKAFWAAAAIAGAVVFNLVLVLALRHALFQHSTRPANVGTSAEMATGNFLQLVSNWRLLVLPAETRFIRAMAAAVLAVLAVLLSISIHRLVQAARRRLQLTPGQVFLHVYLGANLAAILIFADAREWRVYFELIPLLIILVSEADEKKSDPPLRPGRPLPDRIPSSHESVA